MITKTNISQSRVFTADGSANIAFQGADFNVSGIGRVVGANPTKIVTAVGNPALNHVLAANHYGLKVGDAIQFTNVYDEIVTVKVENVVAVVGDVQLVTINRTLSEIGVEPYKTAELSANVITQFLNKIGLFRKKTLSIGVDLATNAVVGEFSTVYNVVRANPTNIAQFRQSKDLTIQPGDSGAPDFIVDGDELKLIGVRSGITAALWMTSSAYNVI